MPLVEKGDVRHCRHPGRDFAPYQSLLDKALLKPLHTDMLMDQFHDVVMDTPLACKGQPRLKASPVLKQSSRMRPQISPRYHRRVLADAIRFGLPQHNMSDMAAA